MGTFVGFATNLKFGRIKGVLLPYLLSFYLYGKSYIKINHLSIWDNHQFFCDTNKGTELNDAKTFFRYLCLTGLFLMNTIQGVPLRSFIGRISGTN